MDEAAILELPRRTGSRRIPANRSRTRANSRETTTTTVRTTSAPIVTTTELPKTSFTCRGKTLGGYYADPEADCQLFHICSQGRHGRYTTLTGMSYLTQIARLKLILNYILSNLVTIRTCRLSTLCNSSYFFYL